MFEVKIVTDFAAAHSLRNYPGECKNVHGHNWKVEIIVRSEDLDSIGLSLDFKSMKKETEDLLDTLDHHYINEVPPFHTLNPSAENIARWLYESLSKRLNTPQVGVARVNVWENDRSCASYYE
jgi:6-pyruvoyltetrahydropterin/6-carboxytetrahydropterin synthase